MVIILSSNLAINFISSMSISMNILIGYSPESFNIIYGKRNFLPEILSRTFRRPEF